MADREVKVTIEVINKAKKGLKEISSDTNKASSELKRMGKDSDKAKGQMDGLNSSIKKLALGYLSFKTLQAGFSEFQSAIKSQEIEMSFNRMAQAAGIASNELVSSLRQASLGTVASTDLMLSANRAMALGVGKNMEDMATLMEIARVKGQDMGLDTTQAFDNIVTGIGRASPLILDNLGIMTKGWAEEAKAAGVAYDAQFILNRVLEQGREQLDLYGDAIPTPAQRMQQLNALFRDVKDQIFRGLIPGFENLTGSIVDGTLDMQKYDEVMKDAARAGFVFGKSLETIFGLVRSVAISVDILATKTVNLVSKFENFKAKAVDSLIGDIPVVGDKIKDWIKITDELTDGSQTRLEDKSQDLLKVMDKTGNAVLDIATGFDEYYEQSKKALESSIAFGAGASGANDDVGAAADDAKDKLKKFEEAYEEIIDASHKFEFETASDFVRFVNNLRDTQSSNDDYISTAKAGFDGLKGKIEETANEISQLEKKLDDAKKSFDDFVSSTTEDSSKSMAQVIFDAEQKIPELQKQLSEAMSSNGGGGERVSEIRQQIKEQKDILKTARQSEYKDNETLQEELSFLRDQSGRNELEQLTSLTERKIEQRRAEYEKEVEVINQQITARENEKMAYEEIQKATTLVLTQNVQARLGQINSEIGATRSLTAALSSLLAMYQSVRAVQSGTSGSSSTTPRRAMGGVVSAGRTYLVGENGPELFSPNSSGAVVPPSRNVNKTVNIYNPVVRSDQDKQQLIEEIKSALSRDDELYTLGAQ